MRAYHTCGHPIWVETRSDELARITVYRDDDEQSATYGEEVTRCPGCAIWLTADELQAQAEE